MHVQGQLADWLQHSLGTGPGTLHPSVRCGLEAALLTALAAAAAGCNLAHLLAPGHPLRSLPMPSAPAGPGSLSAQQLGQQGRSLQLAVAGWQMEEEQPSTVVAINALLECCGSPAEAAAEAAALARQGFAAIKMKVGTARGTCLAGLITNYIGIGNSCRLYHDHLLGGYSRMSMPPCVCRWAGAVIQQRMPRQCCGSERLWAPVWP